MDTVFELVRSLALIAIFASFCELLLPSSNFRSYLRLVVGLLVIAMVLQPILALKGTGLDIEGLLAMNSWSVPAVDSQDNSWVAEQTLKTVEQQLAAEVSEYLGYHYPGYQVSVSLDVSFDQHGNLAEFKGMEVALKPDSQGINPVQPVAIGEDATEIRQPVSATMVNALARHLGLEASILSVWVYTDGGDAGGH